MGSIPVANPTSPRRLHLPRRGLRFLVLLFAVLMVTVVGIAFAWPTGSKVDQVSWFDAGNTSDFAVNQPVRFHEHGFWLVKLGENEFVALLARSPHRGCTVPWMPDFEFMGKKGWFRDPCYQSTWDVTGHLAFGPAPRGMDRFPVRVDNGIVRVNVKMVVEGFGGAAPE